MERKVKNKNKNKVRFYVDKLESITKYNEKNT